MKKEWSDNVIEGMNDFIFKYRDFNDSMNQLYELFIFIQNERSQLYGLCIYLMLSANIKELDFPEMDFFKKLIQDNYLLFDTNDGKIKLLERPEEISLDSTEEV